MRKLFIIFSAVLGCAFTACTGPTNTPEIRECTCEGDHECKYHTATLDLRVMQPDWEFDNETRQFYYHFDVPEITAQVYNFGNWTICREFNSGSANAYQVALPMSIFLSEEVTNEDKTTSTVYYTQYIDYRLGVGYVDIQLTNSDYFYSSENPEDMLFRLQLIY